MYNFTLAAPVLIPGKFQVYDNVVHIPKDMITVLGKQADKAAQLLETFNSWLPRVSLSSESMTSDSSSEGAGSDETNSVESGSEHGSEDHDYESVNVDHDAPGVLSPESSIKSRQSSHDVLRVLS